MPFTSNNGVRIHWDETGQGTPLILVMGHRYSSAMWYPIRDMLAAEHRVIWFDNRGTGQTDSPRGFSVEDMVDDALAVMDAAGVQKAHVFGVSMGGGIVLDLGLRHPDRVTSMILGCTCAKTPDMPSTPAWVRALYFLPPWIMKRLVRNKAPNQGYGSAAAADAIAHDQSIIANDKFSVAGVHAQAGAIARYSVKPEAVAGAAAPSLVMHGNEDATVPYALGVKLAEMLPNSEFVELQGAGHNYFIARREESGAAVLDFLRRVDAGASA